MGYVALNAGSTLAGAVSIGDTSIMVATGHGARFAVGTNYSYITFESATDSETVKLTVRSGDTLTVTATTKAWNVGTIVECRPCAEAVADLKTETQIHAATAGTPVDADEFGFWNSVGSTLGKITLANFKTLLWTAWGALTNSGAAKSTPVNNDAFALMDSAASNATKKLLWSDLMIAIDAYLSPLFAAISGAASQVFSVGSATSAAHAVRADQVQGLSVQAFTTGGTSTAYTLTPTPTISALATNQEFDVTFHTAAGATPTLTISGQTAKSLKYRDTAGAKQAVTSTQVPSSWRSKVVYDGTDYIVREVPPAPAISKYTSLDQVITSAGALTLPHSMGAAPFAVYAELVCQNPELGFSGGDVVAFSGSNFIQDNTSGVNGGMVITHDATNIYVRFGSAASPFALQRKDNGNGGSNITNANWKLRVKAWK